MPKQAARAVLHPAHQHRRRSITIHVCPQRAQTQRKLTARPNPAQAQPKLQRCIRSRPKPQRPSSRAEPARAALCRALPSMCMRHPQLDDPIPRTPTCHPRFYTRSTAEGGPREVREVSGLILPLGRDPASQARSCLSSAILPLRRRRTQTDYINFARQHLQAARIAPTVPLNRMGFTAALRRVGIVLDVDRDVAGMRPPSELDLSGMSIWDPPRRKEV